MVCFTAGLGRPETKPGHKLAPNAPVVAVRHRVGHGRNPAAATISPVVRPLHQVNPITTERRAPVTSAKGCYASAPVFIVIGVRFATIAMARDGCDDLHRSLAALLVVDSGLRVPVGLDPKLW